jgi:hypothetical protein
MIPFPTSPHPFKKPRMPTPIPSMLNPCCPASPEEEQKQLYHNPPVCILRSKRDGVETYHTPIPIIRKLSLEPSSVFDAPRYRVPALPRTDEMPHPRRVGLAAYEDLARGVAEGAFFRCHCVGLVDVGNCVYLSREIKKGIIEKGDGEIESCRSVRKEKVCY